MSEQSQIEQKPPQKHYPLDLLYIHLKDAFSDYIETGSIYARQRAQELIEEVRGGLDNVERLLTVRTGLVARYSEQGENQHDAPTD